MRSWAWAILALVLASGCSSQPEPTAADRAKEQQRALQEAQARRRAYDAARTRAALSGSAQPSMDDIKHDLLNEYGMEMTPFQRTALLTAQISGREEGETMCRRWVAENRRLEAGPGAGGD